MSSYNKTYACKRSHSPWRYLESVLADRRASQLLTPLPQ